MAKVLIVGSGAREHALFEALHKSEDVHEVLVSPGNGGTQQANVSIPADNASLVNWCKTNGVGFVVIGPEDPLAAGVVDALTEANIAAFGPKRAAAEIESSKAFAKAFMRRHNIPTADFAVFSEVNAAKEFIMAAPQSRRVVKASGLCAGKGVVVARDAHEACTFVDRCFEGALGAAGAEVVIEELLVGDEVSIHAFTDGNTVQLLPAAQDHKQLMDGDEGPNTGGMGAYAPTTEASIDLHFIEKAIMQKVVDGLREEGREYRGVLYAGLMLTNEGPKVLEFNCRFGDPETQVMLPLLESDLYTILRSCSYISGAKVPALESMMLEWRANTVACSVVCVSDGYPLPTYKKGAAIVINDILPDDVYIYHAGTRYNEQGQIVTAGGRVLNCVALRRTLLEARDEATRIACEFVQFENKRYRLDIGRRQSKLVPHLSYASAGVHINAGNHLVQLIKPLAASTARRGCTKDIIGGFGACFELCVALPPPSNGGNYRPMLVMGTDGVGTKLEIVNAMRRFDTIGQDLVAMCVNDIICHGAMPLCFLDYYVTGKLDVESAHAVITSIADACRKCNCALVGGETAEMPGVYQPQQWDIAGFVVGALDLAKHTPLPRHDLLRRLLYCCFMDKDYRIKAGCGIIALPSSGIHSNGFSLVRKALQSLGLSYADNCPWEHDTIIGDALLTPTILYSNAIQALMAASSRDKPVLLAAAHITGGGIAENMSRAVMEILPFFGLRSVWFSGIYFRIRKAISLHS